MFHAKDENGVAEITRTLKRMEEEGERDSVVVSCILL